MFDDWNKTELDSFLIEITRDIMKFKDTDGKYLLEKIRDTAGQKGTGKWTAIASLEYGVPVTLIGKKFVNFIYCVTGREVTLSKSEKVTINTYRKL